MGVRRWLAGFLEISAPQSSTRLALLMSVGTACCVALGALALALWKTSTSGLASVIWALGGIILTLGVKTVAAIFGRSKPGELDAPAPEEPPRA